MCFSSLNKLNIRSSIKFCLVIPFAIIVRKFFKSIWIVTERPGQARDNGYCFYKYVKDNHPEQKIYYIIDKKQNDFKKISKYGSVIQFDSMRHYFFYIASRIHISSHINGCNPNHSPICRKLKPVIKYKDVFLPHGVSYGISEFCLKKYAKVDLFICSGRPEYENVLTNYGYDKSEVAYTGFPRLDQWHNIKVNNKQIVLMPTWRAWLAQNKNTIFSKTAYFKTYNSLINNEKLSDILNENELKLVFYLHNDMRKYVNEFSTNCKNIEIVYDDSKYDIQELLKSSALLITDYSSVHFDFAYMNKPVLYFQFDKEEFFKKQYNQSLFDAEKDGFGRVSYDIDDLIENIKCLCSNKFLVDAFYHSRMRSFYELYDNKNCMRVFTSIIKVNDNVNKNN